MAPIYFAMNYGTQKWKNKRNHILKLDGYQCQVARWYGRAEEATIVHHIYPADEYPQYQWMDWNLISVSRKGHELLEDRLRHKLTDMGQSLQDRTVPGIDWRKNRK